MKDSKLTIVATILAFKEKQERVEEELLKLLEPTRAEEGCISYNLHRDNEKPYFFVFVEKWENREIWQKHMSSSHMAQYMEAVDGAVEEFNVYEMSSIEL